MSIFDNDSNKAFEQFVTLTKLIASLSDSDATIKETRAVNLVSSESQAIINQMKYMTSTEQMKKIKPLVEQFEAKIKLSGHEQYSVQSFYNNKSTVFAQADIATTNLNSYINQNNEEKITYKPTAGIHKGKTYTDLGLGDYFSAISDNERATGINNAASEIGDLNKAKEYGYIPKDLSINELIKGGELRVNQLQESFIVDVLTDDDLLGYDLGKYVYVPDDPSTPEIDESVKAREEGYGGRPSDEHFKNKYEAYMQAVIMGQKGLATQLRNENYKAATSGYAASTKEIKISQKGLALARQNLSTQELIDNLSKGDDAEKNIANALVDAIGGLGKISSASQLDNETFFKQRIEDETQNAKVFRKLIKGYTGSYPDKIAPWEDYLPSGSGMGVLNNENVKAGQSAFTLKGDKPSTIDDDEWKYVLKFNGKITEAEYKKYQNNEIIFGEKDADGKASIIDLTNEFGGKKLINIADSYISQEKTPPSTDFTNKDLKDSNFKEIFEHKLKEAYPASEGWGFLYDPSKGYVLNNTATGAEKVFNVSDKSLAVAPVAAPTVDCTDFKSKNPNVNIPENMITEFTDAGMGGDIMQGLFKDFHGTLSDTVDVSKDLDVDFVKYILDEQSNNRFTNEENKYIDRLKVKYSNPDNLPIDDNGIGFWHYLGASAYVGVSVIPKEKKAKIIQGVTNTTKSAIQHIKSRTQFGASGISIILEDPMTKRFLDAETKLNKILNDKTSTKPQVRDAKNLLKSSREAMVNNLFDRIQKSGAIKEKILAIVNKDLAKGMPKGVEFKFLTWDEMQKYRKQNPHKFKKIQQQVRIQFRKDLDSLLKNTKYWNIYGFKDSISKMGKGIKNLFTNKPGNKMMVGGKFAKGYLIYDLVGQVAEEKGWSSEAAFLGGTVSIATVENFTNLIKSKKGRDIIKRVFKHRSGGVMKALRAFSKTGNLGMISYALWDVGSKVKDAVSQWLSEK